MREITLTVTVEEANQILEALGNEPFKEVFGLIGKIQEQAAAQLNDSPSVPTKPVRINPEAPVATDLDAPKK